MDIFKRGNIFTPIVITPPAAWELPNFRELWEYRGLFFFLVRRDILVHISRSEPVRGAIGHQKLPATSSLTQRWSVSRA